MRIVLNDGVVIESVGEDVLVLNPTQGVVERLDGDQAALMRELSNGEVLNMDSSQALESLLDAGVVKQVGVLGRRRAVTLGAAAAGATFVSLSLPTAAMAQSVESPEFGFSILDGHFYDGERTRVNLDLAGLPGAPDASDVIFEISFTSVTGPFQEEFIAPTFSSSRGTNRVFFPLPPNHEDGGDRDAWIRWKPVGGGVESKAEFVLVEEED